MALTGLIRTSSLVFTLNRLAATRGHSLKLYKKSSRLMVRANCFSNRFVDTWNSLTEDIVNAPSLNAFKSRLNRFWQEHPYKFNPSCYAPRRTRGFGTQNQNASEEANWALLDVYIGISRYIYIFFLKSKFSVSNHLLWLFSPVCVGPGRKPQRQVLS